MKNYICALILISIVACQSTISPKDLAYIRSELWVIEKGEKILQGDVLEFDKGPVCELKGDTIFSNNKFIGRIVKYNKNKQEIKIRASSGKVSYYYCHQFE
jgi:hypothetical protein